ncbi:MAG: hypothetical protein PSX81_09525 [bacterium]|nr:hypothetical protein [bacterium]
MYSQKKDPKLEINISSGIQFNRGKINNSNFEKIRKTHLPFYQFGLCFSNRITPKKRFSINLDFNSGKLVRDFNYEVSDSVGKFQYKSKYYYNFISYGFGIQYRYKIKNKAEFLSGIGYYTLSTQNYGEKYHWDNGTGSNISYLREIQSNDFTKNNKFVQIRLGLNLKLLKSEKNTLTILFNTTLMRPLYGSSYFDVNKIKVEESSYKINYSNISIGYTRIIKL